MTRKFPSCRADGGHVAALAAIATRAVWSNADPSNSQTTLAQEQKERVAVGTTRLAARGQLSVSRLPELFVEYVVKFRIQLLLRLRVIFLHDIQFLRLQTQPFDYLSTEFHINDVGFDMYIPTLGSRLAPLSPLMIFLMLSAEPFL